MDGVLVIDKSSGLTSHDVVVQVRRILKQKRIGHTGTLDPFATGVLPLCLGRATRLARFWSGGGRRYHGTIRLGSSTDTQDPTGKVVDTTDVPSITEDQVSEVFQVLSGKRTQVPPMYSAKKIGGLRLYRLARKGETVDRPAVPIRIDSFELIKLGRDFIEFAVSCSSGTYVRTLAEEVAQKLGCAGHLESLERTRCAGFSLDEALALEELEAASSDGRMEKLVVPMERALRRFPSARVRESARSNLLHGADLFARDLESPQMPEQETESPGPEVYWNLLGADGRLLAVAQASGAKAGPPPIKEETTLRFPAVLHPVVVVGKVP